MKMKKICAAYPNCNGAGNNICQREAYGSPIGMGGVGLGYSFANNSEALRKVRLKTRLVGPHFRPDTSLDFFGVKLAMPIMGASTSGVSSYNEDIDEAGFCAQTVSGCIAAGTITFRGDTHLYPTSGHYGLAAIRDAGGKGVPIFKPRAQDVLKRLIEEAEQAGCAAVGVDLDGCGSTNMERAGCPVFRKSPAEIAELVRGTSLPFVAKGIMDPDDAAAAVDAGVAVVSVSNHGGRVLDTTPGVAEVLPAIADRVGGKVMITADGGVRTGFDVMKMLALGADAVLLGRDLIRASIGGGAEGVQLQMELLHKTLKRAMVMTGCPDLSSVGPGVLC